MNARLGRLNKILPESPEKDLCPLEPVSSVFGNRRETPTRQRIATSEKQRLLISPWQRACSPGGTRVLSVFRGARLTEEPRGTREATVLRGEMVVRPSLTRQRRVRSVRTVRSGRTTSSPVLYEPHHVRSTGGKRAFDSSLTVESSVAQSAGTRESYRLAIVSVGAGRAIL